MNTRLPVTYANADVVPNYPVPCTDDDAQAMIGLDAIIYNKHIQEGCLECLHQWFDSLGVEY